MFVRFFTRIAVCVRRQIARLKADSRYKKLVRDLLSRVNPRLKLVAWEEAGGSHIVACAYSGILNYLFVIDTDFSVIAASTELCSVVERFSGTIDGYRIRISVCHSLISNYTHAYSFFQFNMNTNELTEDFDARLRFLADLNR